MITKSKIFEYQKMSKISKITWRILFITILSIILIACTGEGIENILDIEETEDLIAERYIAEENNPTFLELEYMYSIEDVDLSRINSNNFREFTWFETSYPSPNRPQTFENMNRYLIRNYDIELPENFDLDSNSFIAISIGRRLESIYYFRHIRHHVDNNEVVAHPIFERGYYYPNTVFVYRVTPIPTYVVTSQWLFTDYFRQLNVFNNIPHDVWIYPAESVKTELEAPLYGYINTQEAYLRWFPTRNSAISHRLGGGVYLTITAYVEGGEDIDGNSRWYFVIGHADNGFSTSRGYIHSSFVTFSAED